jgi:hypothetical protein
LGAKPPSPTRRASPPDPRSRASPCAGRFAVGLPSAACGWSCGRVRVATHATLCKMERGTHGPSLETLVTLCDACGVDVYSVLVEVARSHARASACGTRSPNTVPASGKRPWPRRSTGRRACSPSLPGVLRTPRRVRVRPLRRRRPSTVLCLACGFTWVNQRKSTGKPDHPLTQWSSPFSLRVSD